MTEGYKREISAEMYARAVANRGYLMQMDYNQVFSISEQIGYGVYSARVGEHEGKYYVYFSLGSSCD